MIHTNELLRGLWVVSGLKFSCIAGEMGFVHGRTLL